MDIEKIQQYCSRLAGVTEDLKWENDLCFLVAAKMFCVVGLNNTPLTLSFKTSEEEFTELTGRPGIIPAPYLGKHQWVMLKDIHLLPESVLLKYIKGSYLLIAAKLPAKTRKSLGLS